MKHLSFGLLVVAGLLAASSAASIQSKANERRMVCFFGSWAVYRPGNGKFDVENIDPALCTHVIYSFTGLGLDNKIQLLDAWNDVYDNYGKGAMERFVGLKKTNPNLKTLVAIGGWNEGSEKYSRMVADATKRATFVQSVVEFLEKYRFDGLDLDWEYPAVRGGVPIDKQNFILLLRDLKEAFAPKGWIVTAAVSAGRYTMEVAYDIPSMALYLDQLHLMSYDYHGGNWESVTGINSPLYANPNFDKNDNLFLNTNWSVNQWISQGFPANKISLGMPLYAQGWTLASATNNGLYAPANNGITPGPYTQQTGVWGYNELCEKRIADPTGWTVVRDSCYLTPYMYKGNQWVSYDDRESMLIKGQYVAAMGLGGSMVWSVETDDFRGLCGGGTFPLIKAIVQGMNTPNPVLPANPCNNQTITPTPTPTPSTTSTPRSSTTTTSTASATSTTTTTVRTPTPSPTTARTPSTNATSGPVTPSTLSTSTAAPVTTTRSTTTTVAYTTSDSLSIYCKKDGLNKDPNDCGKFYNCVSNGSGGWTVYSQACAPGTVFSDVINGCAYPQNVPGCENYYGR